MSGNVLTREGLGVTLDIPPLATALTYSSQTALGVQISRLQLFYGFLNGWNPGGLSTADSIAFQNQKAAFLASLLDILTQLVNADHAQLVFLQQELSTVEGLMASNAALTAQVQGNPLPAAAPAPAAPAPSSATSATAPSTSTTSPAPSASPWPWGLGGTVIGGILGFAVGRKTAKKR